MLEIGANRSEQEPWERAGAVGSGLRTEIGASRNYASSMQRVRLGWFGNRPVQVADMKEMWTALTTCGQYNFLGCLGMFDNRKTASPGCWPSAKGARVMKGLHFTYSTTDEAMNFPVTLRVSVPITNEVDLQGFYGRKGWRADNGDLLRFGLLMAVAETDKDSEEGRKHWTKLMRCCNSIVVPPH